MPKFRPVKRGHLIKGETEYTVVRCVALCASNSWHEHEYKEATYPTVELAADHARRGWIERCEAGLYNETYKVYLHTKGKLTYSNGHFRSINWIDYDYTVPNKQP